ncbi:MAG: hypothetical protein U0441_14910 [Polyangiaceae bacterium]
MEWSASFDTSGVVDPAKAAESAITAMRSALMEADSALKSFGSGAAGSIGAGVDAAEKLAGATQAAQDALNKLKAPQGATVVPPFSPSFDKPESKEKASSSPSKKKGKKDGIPDVSKAAGDAGKAGEKAGASLAKSFSSAKDGAGSMVSTLKGALPLMAAMAGGAGFVGIAKIAIGYRALSQMQGILARTQVGFRQLFTGVDPQPLVRALDRFSKNFTAQTVMGRALGDVMTRAFNGIFSVVEKVEPYVTAFGQGMVLAFLLAENAVLRARIALQPYTGALDGLVSSSSLMKAAALGGGLALGVMAGYAVVAAAPFLALAAAIGAVTAAFEQASKLAKEWDGSALVRQVGSDLGLLSQQDWEKSQGITVGSDKDVTKANDAGMATGKAMGDGVVAGLKSSEAAAKAAGESLAAAADAGVRAKAEIHSPSRLFRRTARHMGEGQALGLEDSEDRVQKAAASSLVPDPQKLPALGARGAGASFTGPLVSIGQLIVQGGDDLATEIRRVIAVEAARVAENLGLTVPSEA